MNVPNVKFEPGYYWYLPSETNNHVTSLDPRIVKLEQGETGPLVTTFYETGPRTHIGYFPGDFIGPLVFEDEEHKVTWAELQEMHEKVEAVLNDLSQQYDLGGDEDEDGSLCPGVPNFEEAKEKIAVIMGIEPPSRPWPPSVPPDRPAWLDKQPGILRSKP